MTSVLLVDDSAIVRLLVKQILSETSDLTIVGEAQNGEQAVNMNRELKPGLIIMDINMPVMNGIEATRRIMADRPVPILIFSTEDSATVGYSAVMTGAVDIMKKPEFSSFTPEFTKEFLEKIRFIASSSVAARNKICSSLIKSTSDTALEGINTNKLQFNTTKSVTMQTKFDESINNQQKYKILLIGASTGGPVAVLSVLQGLGRYFPLPILLTQHIDTSFDDYYVKWLADTTKMNVELAVDGVEPLAGNVYVAPAGYHLVLKSASNTSGCVLSLSTDEPICFLKPAVDKMFLSGSEVFGKSCLACLLTGMGRDGANGCKAIIDAGGYTVVESEETCAVFGMPKAAIESGGASKVLPLYEIPQCILRIVKE